MTTTKKFKLSTLGCRTNQYETQAYRDQLIALGFIEATTDEEADLCIVNTCTVTQNADQSSLKEIKRLRSENQHARVVVTGCMAESLPKNEHLTIIPNNRKTELIAELFPEEEDLPEFAIKEFDGHTRAFVKVQDGCNSFCTYCIIPYVRGRSVSRKKEEIISEIEDLIRSGYQEVVITGINVGDYEGGLADLVRHVDAIQGLKRLRLSSIDPDEVDENLQDAILNGKTTCPSLHLVLQSGSNATLKRMNRKYTKQIFLETIRRLRAASPHFSFTTDIIVGFPGETEEDFEETLSVMREVKFAKVHMFPYSPRKRTRAALYPDQISAEIIKKRKEILLRENEKIAFALREEFLGLDASVLIEGDQMGHSEHFLPVKVLGNPQPNTIVRVQLIENTPECLIGQPLS